MSTAPIHLKKRPESQRPLCETSGIPARNITIYPHAVTCPACKQLMKSR